LANRSVVAVTDHTLRLLPASDLDLEMTLHSGQVFHWLPHGNGFLGAIGDHAVYVEQKGENLHTSAEQAELVRHYFALDHPMDRILATFPRDETMIQAVQFSKGMRIIRQPTWECLATFITSALKQVQHIRAISLALRQRFGRSVHHGKFEARAYPRPEVLAAANLEALLECKLGFRAKNLLATAKIIASGEIDLEELGKRPTSEVRKTLCRLPGVGEKIANCVLLFAYERFDAFPIDVWIARMLRERYFAKRPVVRLGELQEFTAEYFGPYGGYAQQYLFHHWRLTQQGRRSGRKSDG
jgi:N-glycosylase/DNA lyase